MRVRFSSGAFFVSGDITNSGEVENFEMGDEAEEILFEGISYETLSRLLEHIRVEQHRLMYPLAQQASGGPLVGGNKEPEPPIEGELDG
jgi:hypothetical protein